MGIWRVLTATVYCDTCGKAIASLEFDAADAVNIERIRVWCADCRAIKNESNQTNDQQGVIKPREET